MSGIAGIIHFDSAPVLPGQVERMTAAMAYRGPDGIGHWSHGSVALGHCMLRTTPESLEDIQPLLNDDGSLVLVLDGRVDNWLELRAQLIAAGVRLRNRSDAELVLRAYERWGRDCLQYVDGDFALVIWDARRREAFCARDRLGNKTLHYHWNGRTLAFATELHPILGLPWVEQTPNEGMLSEFLAAEWHSRDETLWKGVMRLAAAQRMVVGESGPKLDTYWQPDLWATLPYRRDEEFIEHYRELFSDRVRRASRSHLPVSFEVSGGLDSSAVFCMAEQLRRAGSLPAPTIDAYTLAFTDDSEANELDYARAVATHLGVPVNEVPPTTVPTAWYAETAAHYRNFPGFPNGTMFQGIRSRMADRGSRVAVTGEGGDEWLAGSGLYYAEALVSAQLGMLFACLRDDLAAFGIAGAGRRFLRDGVLPVLPAAAAQTLTGLYRRIAGGAESGAYWLSPRMRSVLDERRARSAAGLPTAICRVGQKELLLTLSDAMSDHVMERAERDAARDGLELRYPMRSADFVQFAFSTPERLRRRGATSKYVHVEALHGVLPQAILGRTGKAEFSSVPRSYLDGMLERFAGEIPQRRPEWFSRPGLNRLLDEYRTRPRSGAPIWALWAIYCADLVVPRREC